MIAAKAKAVCLTWCIVVIAGCNHSDPATRARMDKAKWKSGLEPVNAGKLTDVLPPEPDILPQTHFAAARLLEGKGMISEAMVQYRKAIAVNHDYAAAYHALAVLLSRAGDSKAAVEAMSQAARISPDDAAILNNLGFLLMHRERWGDAIEKFSAAIEQRPFFARARINLGLCFSRLGRFDEAFASFRVVLPEADAHYNMGLMYRGRKRYEDSARSFRRVLEINPAFVAATRQLEEINRFLTRVEPEIMSPPEMTDADPDASPREAMVTVDVPLDDGPVWFLDRVSPDVRSSSWTVMRDEPARDDELSSPADFMVSQADFDYDLAECQEELLAEAMGDEGAFALSDSSRQQEIVDTCPADFEPEVASFDEDLLLCEAQFRLEAMSAVATVGPRLARARLSMEVRQGLDSMNGGADQPGVAPRVSPIDWSVALAELWEEIPPEEGDPCIEETVIVIPDERMSVVVRTGDLVGAVEAPRFVGDAAEEFSSPADPAVVRAIERDFFLSDPSHWGAKTAAISGARGASSEALDPIDRIRSLEALIAIERSEQACLAQSLGRFASGRWVDTSVSDTAAVYIPEFNARDGIAYRESTDGQATGSALRKRGDRNGAGPATLGMSIIESPRSQRARPEPRPQLDGGSQSQPASPCRDESDKDDDQSGTFGITMVHLFDLLNVVDDEQRCLDAVAMWDLLQPERMDTSPSDWDDGGVAERDMAPYGRATMSSRVTSSEQKAPDGAKRRVRPLPRRYRLGKPQAKGMIDPVRD